MTGSVSNAGGNVDHSRALRARSATSIRQPSQTSKIDDVEIRLSPILLRGSALQRKGKKGCVMLTIRYRVRRVPGSATGASGYEDKSGEAVTLKWRDKKDCYGDLVGGA